MLCVSWRERTRSIEQRRHLWVCRALGVAVAVLAAGCSVGAPGAEHVDFIGEVVSADTENWRIDGDDSAIAFSTGGSDSRMRVGPATFHLADGSTIDVPAETPGGNLCSLLGWRDQPRTPTCLMVGEFDEAGAAAWFSIEPFDNVADGSFQLTVDRFDGRDAIVLIGGTWLAVPVPPDATLTCSEPGDLASTPVEVPSRSALVVLDADLEVVAVECLHAE